MGSLDSDIRNWVRKRGPLESDIGKRVRKKGSFRKWHKEESGKDFGSLESDIINRARGGSVERDIKERFEK
jgi:hypothetical protein